MQPAPNGLLAAVTVDDLEAFGPAFGVVADHTSGKPTKPTTAPPSLLAQAVDLGQLVRDGIPPARFVSTPTLGGDLFYEQSVALISGHRKHGKTNVVAFGAVDHMRAGHHVMYLDWENGEGIIAEKFAAMHVEPDLLSTRFHYVAFPRGVELDTFADQLREVAAGLPGVLFVIDSWRGVQRNLGRGVL